MTQHRQLGFFYTLRSEAVDSRLHTFEFSISAEGEHVQILVWGLQASSHLHGLSIQSAVPSKFSVWIGTA